MKTAEISSHHKKQRTEEVSSQIPAVGSRGCLQGIGWSNPLLQEGIKVRCERTPCRKTAAPGFARHPRGPAGIRTRLRSMADDPSSNFLEVFDGVIASGSKNELESLLAHIGERQPGSTVSSLWVGFAATSQNYPQTPHPPTFILTLRISNKYKAWAGGKDNP